MRAKKLIAIAMLAAIGTTAQAQIVSSRSDRVIVTEVSKPKKPKKPHYLKAYVKAGIGVDMFYETYKSFSQFGYELDLGLKGNIGQQGAFWGTELGCMSGMKIEDDWKSWYLGLVHSDSNFSLLFNPYAGWNFNIGGTTTLSPSIGPWVSYGFNEEEFRAGVSLGVNFWFNRQFAVGVNYKRDVTDDDYFHKIIVSGTITF